jgi:predicted ATPase
MVQSHMIADAAGADIMMTHSYRDLSEAYMLAGRIDDALDMMTEALACIDRLDEHFVEADIYRLKGELSLRQNGSDTENAKHCFEHAIEIARKQTAKSLELRATTSLARLLAAQGRRDEAYATLATIYDWFTEGFDTADLKEAKPCSKR